MKYKIAFFGSSLVSAYWNGAATYYRGIIKALAERGHSVTFYEPDIYERQKHRDIAAPDWANDIVYQPDESELTRILENLSNFDVLVKASGVGIFDEFLEAALLKIKKDNQLAVFWDVDAPATLERMISNPDDQFNKLVPEYDLILTYGGGDPVIKAYEKAGTFNCIPIYNALDPRTHYPVKPVDKYRCDLAFLGNRLPDREKRVEHFFLEPASRMPDKNFILGGSGWADKSISSNVNYLGHIYTKDHNKFNCSPDAVLNISRDSMARFGFSPATRVFEAAGAGACIITDYWKGIEHFFEPEKEILIAQNSDEVIDILRELNPEKSRQIGIAAYCKVLTEHTYKHRAVQLEQILNEQFNEPKMV